MTTVRFHLDQLVAVCFLVTTFERNALVGRPRKWYAAAPVPGEDRPDLDRHFEILAGLLATSWPAEGRPQLTPYEAGSRWALDLSLIHI